jgi:hypothetical protein
MGRSDALAQRKPDNFRTNGRIAGIENQAHQPKIQDVTSATVYAFVDPRATEAFLLNQPDVLDASVWLSEGRLRAHVTVHEECSWSSRALRIACAEFLGLHQAPEDIQILSARRRAA